MDDHHKIRLVIDPETRAVLEKRRLRDEDIQKTLAQAEKTGKKFIHPDNSHFLAGVRQDAVSVWVEYAPREDGFEIYKAYQYRLTISAWDLKTGRTRSEPV
jgi:glutamate synthase (NADPH) small chain